MVLEVSYDLHNPGRDYTAVINQIKAAENGWAHAQESVWLIDTRQEPMWWVERLMAAGDNNDEYVVTRLSNQEWASYNLNDEIITWLKAPGRSW